MLKIIDGVKCSAPPSDSEKRKYYRMKCKLHDFLFFI